MFVFVRAVLLYRGVREQRDCGPGLEESWVFPYKGKAAHENANSLLCGRHGIGEEGWR